MARWRAKWVLGMLWKITENPMAKAFRKVMSVWGCLMVDGLSCSSGFQLESSREQKLLAGDGKSLSPFFCLYWPPARNLFLFAGINSLFEGANVRTNTFEQPVRDFDVLVCTKRLCHLFSWSLCKVEIHRTYTDSLATSMWLQMLEVEATTCSTNDHVFREWGQLTHPRKQFCWQVAPSANVEVSLPQNFLSTSWLDELGKLPPTLNLNQGHFYVNPWGEVPWFSDIPMDSQA